MARLRIVAVIGSGRESSPLTEQVGELVASRGAHLLTGGGGGQMESVARGFCRTAGRRGLSLGVLPCRGEGDWVPPPGYPNRYVEVPIQTHLWLSGEQGQELASRNSINVLTSDAVVALYGSAGTISEARLARTARRPLCLFLPPQTALRAAAQIDALELLPLSELSQLADWLDDVLGADPGLAETVSEGASE